MPLQDNIPMPLMRCDHTGLICLAEVRRAPIIVIPPVEMIDRTYRAIRIPTTLHYCERHRGDFDVQTYLSMAQKTRIERAAKLMRPADWRPDFDAALADLVLVTCPEYRRFLVYIGATTPEARDVA